MERRVSRSAGYAIVLVGVITFVVGGFLPYLGPGGPAGTISLFRLLVIPPFDDQTDLVANVGGFLYLFGGVATLAWVAIAGMRGSRWTRSALAALTVAWSLTWIGSLLRISMLAFDTPRRVGWLVLLLGVVVVVIGTIVMWVIDRRTEAPAEVPASANHDVPSG